MERVDTEGQVATAATMARMLSSIPLSAMGPARVMIFDIHALQVSRRLYFFLITGACLMHISVLFDHIASYCQQ